MAKAKENKEITDGKAQILEAAQLMKKGSSSVLAGITKGVKSFKKKRKNETLEEREARVMSRRLKYENLGTTIGQPVNSIASGLFNTFKGTLTAMTGKQTKLQEAMTKVQEKEARS